jgi:hypothetical protein
LTTTGLLAVFRQPSLQRIEGIPAYGRRQQLAQSIVSQAPNLLPQRFRQPPPLGLEHNHLGLGKALFLADPDQVLARSRFHEFRQFSD